MDDYFMKRQQHLGSNHNSMEQEIPTDKDQMQPEELSGAEWETPWDEFAAQATPFICIMPPQPPDDEIFIEQPMPDDQLIENEVPCDL